MKKTKFFAVIMTTFALLLGAGTSVLAEEEENTPTVDITKVYKLLNAETSAPEETFTFKVEKHSTEDSSWTVDEMPMLKDSDGKELTDSSVTIEYGENDTVDAEGSTKTVKLNFPIDDNTKPGKYTYRITETKGSTSGVVYDNRVIYATVLVVNDENDGVKVESVTYTVEGGKLGDKDGFTNIYQAVKELTIEKTVTGNLGDKSKYFAVDITVNGPNGVTTPATFRVLGGSYTENEKEIKLGTKTTFYLKDGETIKIENVPYGFTYTVVEHDYTSTENGGYDSAKYTLNGTSKGTTSVNGEPVDSDIEDVEITNNKGTQIDTGVVLDNLPYIILLGIVIGAAVVWFLRRRLNADRD